MNKSYFSITLVTFIFIFGSTTLIFNINVNNVNAEEAKVVDWDRLLIDEINELNDYIEKIYEENTNNNFTAIRIDSKNILLSSGFRNISAELEYRGNTEVVQAFINTVSNLTELSPSDKEKMNENINNLSFIRNEMINTLSIPDIDYQKLIIITVISSTIFIVSILMIPKVRSHHKIKF